MSTYDDTYTLTQGGPTGARFFIIFAAIAAVCVLSSVPVLRELAGSPPARATTAATAPTAATALTWDLQPRWWPGEVSPAEVRPVEVRPAEGRQVNRQASTVPDRQASPVPESDLTFAKGYSLRLAARQAASPVPLAASGSSSESQFGRSAIVVRKANTFARADGAPNLRPVAAAHIDALVERPGPLESGNPALAFGEQRSQRGQGGPFANLFGNLY